MPEDKTLARIRALLAMAEDPAASPAEAQTFTAKAAELIAKYGIDQALLAAHQPVREIAGDRIIVMQGAYQRDKVDLLYRVATPLGCQTVARYPRPGRPNAEGHLFGMPSDLQRAELLFTSLLVQVANGLAVERPRNPVENIKAFRRSWISGFSMAIFHRLTQAEQRAKQDAQEQSPAGPSVELVLLDRAALVVKARDAAYPKLRQARRTLSGTGHDQGWTAGQRANLGGTAVPNRPGAALGR